MSSSHKVYEEQKIAFVGKSENPIMKLRPNDFSKGGEKSLLKPHSLFIPVKNEEDVFCKKTKTSKVKHYFAKGHEAIEYFAMEILVALGFHTPKCRLTEEALTVENLMVDVEEPTADKAMQEEQGSADVDEVIETIVQKVEGYIPMLDVRHDAEVADAKYKLDIPNQQLISLLDGKRYKISGNVFASDLAAIALHDTDFQPDATNVGLVRCGNRFYCVLIDKENVSLEGKSYEGMLQINANSSEEEIIFVEALTKIAKDALYASRYQDQVQFVLSKYAELLMIRDKQCNLDRIFLNPRVKKTKILPDLYKNECENFKKTALSVLQYYQKVYGEDFLTNFAKRDALRAQIVAEVIKQLSLHPDVKDILMEDLRGPYYAKYFLNGKQISEDDLKNPDLFNAIIADVVNEFGLVAKAAESPKPRGSYIMGCSS